MKLFEATFANEELFWLAVVAAPVYVFLLHVYDHARRGTLTRRLGELPTIGRVIGSASHPRRVIKDILVGCIDVASKTVETPEQVSATLREAMQYADAERIQACTNCGLAPFPRGVAEAKLQALGAGARLMRKRA